MEILDELKATFLFLRNALPKECTIVPAQNLDVLENWVVGAWLMLWHVHDTPALRSQLSPGKLELLRHLLGHR